MGHTFSPLRYPGGKSKLYQFVLETIKRNKIEKPIYCEPFCGGAGIAINLLLSESVDSIIINDYDTAIYSIWYAIVNDTENFIKKIRDTDIDMNMWHIQKNIYDKCIANNSDYNLEFAFATFFLNRTNVSGIIEGGPIGGYKQQSNYKVYCRFNKESLIKKITDIANFKEKISLYNKDASALVGENLINCCNENLFVYFDPPYYKQGKNLYKNFFDDNDHVALAQSIKRMDNYKWITTYDNSTRIQEIYSDRDIYGYELQYSVNKVRKETELMFASKTTKLSSGNNVKLHKLFTFTK